MFDFLFNYLWSKIKEESMKPRPSYYIALAALIAFGLTTAGCMYFDEKPDMKLLAQRAAAAERIAERTLDNHEEFQKVLALAEDALEAEGIVKEGGEGESLLDPRVKKFAEGLLKYKALRDADIKNLLKYLSLDMKEYEAIFKLHYGELPADYSKLVQDALLKIEAAREKQFPEDG